MWFERVIGDEGLLMNSLAAAKENRTAFPPVFWIANSIEILERFAYYGIYFGFGIYMESLGYTRAQLGVVQSVFLFFSYGIPVISGSFADRFGFKKVLIVSYLAYLPSILLLMYTKSYSGIVLTMLTIGLSAGIFKPLIAGTVRAVTDRTNKTLGFGIFYAMVNIGGTIGPLVLGKLRAISWDYAFKAAAISIGVMFLVTLFFYREPDREIDSATLGRKMKEIGFALRDLKFTILLILLGLFFWLPFWAFFNLSALYVDRNLDTTRLYDGIRNVFGLWLAQAVSHIDEHGVRRILGETVATTGYIVMIFQVFVSRITERFKAMPTFLAGVLMLTLGFLVIGIAKIAVPAVVFLGIFIFAIGEMISSPRLQEYITWIAPKEKAGLYIGMNFLATMLGSLLSGVTYTRLSGYFNDSGSPEYVWYVLAVHTFLGVIALAGFTKIVGEFKEQEN
jgi:proton-dependent oligopeptide transporter, POT family